MVITLQAQAAPTPSMIRLHILKLQVPSEVQPRWKNALPPKEQQVWPIKNSIRSELSSPIHLRNGSPTNGPMVRRSKGIAARTLTQRRQVKSISSWLGSSDKQPIGSSAMLQFGQGTGLCSRTSGHIGQIYCTPSCTTILRRLLLPET